MMDSEELLLCHHCGKIFYKLSSLESHTRWKHMEKSNDFMCEQCGKTFHKKFNLIKHLASGVHQISESVKCALCDFKALTRKIMCGHYRCFHEIALNERNAYFKTSDEFFLWKIQYENSTRSRFVKMSSSRKRKNGFLRSTYFCHRDGNFIPKGKNLRHLKVKGSNKINAHCPAKIEVEIGDSITIVSYIDTHLGHDLDITRMNLDPNERAIIAEKLALKVPFEQILEEINNKTHDSSVRRINLLTRKDLWNIVETFKINPKTVVYSKTRARRTKTVDQPKIEPSKNGVYLKVKSEPGSEKQYENYLSSTIVKEEEFTDEQVVEINDVNDDSHFLYPIIVKDENNEDVHQYVVISNENITDDGECLIINSKEIESISKNQLVYSDGGLQICQNDRMQTPENCVNGSDECVEICENIGVQTNEDDIQIYEGDAVQISDDNEIQILDSDDIKIFENNGVQILESDCIQICGDESFQISEDGAVEIYEVDGSTHIDSANQICENLETNKIDLQYFSNDNNGDLNNFEYSCPDKSVIQPIADKKCEDSNISLQNKGENELTVPKNIKVTVGNQEYQLIYNIAETNNDDVINGINEINVKRQEDSEIIFVDSTIVDNKSSSDWTEEMSLEHVPGCEVTINNFEEKDSSDYLIIPDCKEGMEHCNLNSNHEDDQQNSYPTISTVKLKKSKPLKRGNSDVSNTVIKLEVPDYCLLDGEHFVEECGVNESEGQQWNKKREDVLNKVLNVHSMINNEQQLKIFSNNIISLENVLKSMSKSDDVLSSLCSDKTKENKHTSSFR